MGGRLSDVGAVLLGTLLLASPLLVGAALVLIANHLTKRWRLVYLPVALATAIGVVGLVRMATAGDGLGGVGEVMMGAYLAGVGGLSGLVCGVLVYTRRPPREHRRTNSAQ